MRFYRKLYSKGEDVMAEKVPRMSKEELRERLHEVVVLDVRSEKDWNESDLKILGSRREIPAEENRWMELYPKGQTYVLYCA
jgi:rhodanese-related sulfurtransferase